MNKSELVAALAKEQNLSTQTASSILSTIFEVMTEAMVNGDNVEIRGFGSFTIRKYNGYTGRNPKTGEKLQVNPKKIPFFKVGKDLRKTVNMDRN